MGLFDFFSSSDSNKKKCANCGKATDLTVIAPNGKEFCSKLCMIEWIKKMTGAS